MMSKKKTAAPAVTEATYDVLIAPVVTEKAAKGSEHNQVTFRVAKDATKPQIKAAVESLFKVKVKAVNTLTLPGKVKRFRGIEGKRSDIKKAIVTLEKGNTIDLTASV